MGERRLQASPIGDLPIRGQPSTEKFPITATSQIDSQPAVATRQEAAATVGGLLALWPDAKLLGSCAQHPIRGRKICVGVLVLQGFQDLIHASA